MTSLGDRFLDVFFGVKTPRLVHVRSFKIGLLNRLVQFTIIAYVIGYAIIYKKGYQETDMAQSSVTTKVKGIASTLDRMDVNETYRRVWDTADYVVPAQENGGFFVMTNAVITPNQQLGKCIEEPRAASCTNSKLRCKNGMFSTNGVMTGLCNKTTNGSACEIFGWCPVERDDQVSFQKALLGDAEHFTVFIKNSIEFPKFKVKRRNILEGSNLEDNLKNCRHSKNDTACPIFALGYIVHEAGGNFSEIAILGGIINIMIDWECNLDYDSSYCIPRYKFSRLDYDEGNVSVGWNFRFATYHKTKTSTPVRDLYKAYGIRFVLTVQATAGRFSVVPLILNLAAGLAMLSIAVILCDFYLSYIAKIRDSYQKNKFLKLTAEDFNLAHKDDHNSAGGQSQEDEDKFYDAQSRSRSMVVD